MSARLTIDELAEATGLTVRNCRYYASLGLIPPPERRGRVAYYGPAHVGRLQLVRALQDHGYTLAAIERFLAQIPEDASPETLAIQRSMMTSWAPDAGEELTAAELSAQVGRDLDPTTLQRLVAIDVLTQRGERFITRPGLEAALELLDLDLPWEGVVKASEAIRQHTDELARELTVVLRDWVIAPRREAAKASGATQDLDQTLARLRHLTLEAIVGGFRRASDEIVTRSLQPRAEDATDNRASQNRANQNPGGEG